MGIGKYLKELIAAKGITLKELANLSGVPVNTLYSMTQRDQKRINIQTAQKLAKALNVPVENLISSHADKILSETLTQKMKEADMSIQDLEHYSRISQNRLKNILSGSTPISLDDFRRINNSINYYGRMRALNDDMYSKSTFGIIDSDSKTFGFIEQDSEIPPHISKDRLLQEFEDRIHELDTPQLKALILIVDAMVKSKEYDRISGQEQNPFTPADGMITIMDELDE